jgi:hypothetical protein
MKKPRVLKESSEVDEDRALAKLAETREQTFDRSQALTHSQIWAHLRLPRR